MVASLWVYAVTPGTRSNGPGVRSILHLSGCSIRCKGCFSPHTWNRSGGKELPVTEVAAQLLATNPDGVTISGGEPTEQLPALVELLVLLDAARRGGKLRYGVLMYTGTTEAQRDALEQWPFARSLLDGAVVGPYDSSNPLFPPERLCSSANQRLLLFGDLLTYEMFDKLPTLELVATPDGVRMLGFPRSEDVRNP